MNTPNNIAVLFCRPNSIYKTLPGCDVYDIQRDARTYSDSYPVIAHPPCRAWGQLRHMSKPRPDEKELAFFAIDQVRRCGGVLEHPATSSLWPVAGLPVPGVIDEFGGFTWPVYQSCFGHRARKATYLYIVGASPRRLPVMPLILGKAPGLVELMGRSEREATPPMFASWLVALARSCAFGSGECSDTPTLVRIPELNPVDQGVI